MTTSRREAQDMTNEQLQLDLSVDPVPRVRAAIRQLCAESQAEEVETALSPLIPDEVWMELGRMWLADEVRQQRRAYVAGLEEEARSRVRQAAKDKERAAREEEDQTTLDRLREEYSAAREAGFGLDVSAWREYAEDVALADAHGVGLEELQKELDEMGCSRREMARASWRLNRTLKRVTSALAFTDAFLAQEFALDAKGHKATWGEATVSQHRQRINFVWTQNVSPALDDIGLHEHVIGVIEHYGSSNLRQARHIEAKRIKKPSRRRVS